MSGLREWEVVPVVIVVVMMSLEKTEKMRREKQEGPWEMQQKLSMMLMTAPLELLSLMVDYPRSSVFVE